MDEQKQIEKMAVILTDGSCEECNCDDNGRFNCLAFYEAERLYNAGCRIQSEAEWIVVYEYNDYRMRKEAKIACSDCGHKPKYEGYLSDMNYCPKCGAKMKGESNEN